MQINLLSPATNRGLKDTNSANKTLLISAIVIWVIIIGGYLGIFLYNKSILNKIETLNEENESKITLINKINLNSQIKSEISKKEGIIGAIEAKKAFWIKILKEIKECYPANVGNTILKIENTEGGDKNKYKITLEGDTIDYALVEKLQSNLQYFGKKNSGQKGIFADSKIKSAELTDEGRIHYVINIFLVKEVKANV